MSRDFEPVFEAWNTLSRVPYQTKLEMQELLSEEAYLLDMRAFDEWLSWLHDDVQYLMPIITNRRPREYALAVSSKDDVAHFDEDKTSFSIRIRRLGTNMAWAEDPPSRIRRFVSNIVVRQVQEGQFAVRSYVDAYRSRVDDERGRFTGVRYDIWERGSGSGKYLLLYRRIVPDDVVLSFGNLSFWV